MTSRVGILGGTFDPVHNAHLAVARAALEQLGLEQILWMPTGAPAYRRPALASGADRVAMLKLALGGEPRYAIDERELRPDASGYTFDSVSALKEENPDSGFVLLMGADQYERRDTWHRWPDIEKLCQVAVVARPGSTLNGKVNPIQMAAMSTSASDIRARISRGEDVSAMLPGPVLAYILEKGLYR